MKLFQIKYASAGRITLSKSWKHNHFLTPICQAEQALDELKIANETEILSCFKFTWFWCPVSWHKLQDAEGCTGKGEVERTVASLGH